MNQNTSVKKTADKTFNLKKEVITINSEWLTPRKTTDPMPRVYGAQINKGQ